MNGKGGSWANDVYRIYGMRVFFVIVLFKVHNSVGIVLEGD